jgi:hypothetical protein
MLPFLTLQLAMLDDQVEELIGKGDPACRVHPPAGHTDQGGFMRDAKRCSA